MSNLQEKFIKFHETIKLKRFDENQSLKDKRDLLLEELKGVLKDEKIPGTEEKLTFRHINQGSYAMGTGIIPKKGTDYDIDVGIIFNITKEEYESSKLKKLVYEALGRKRTVSYKKPCITADYPSEDFHVDIAIYAENNSDIHIAWGKENAEEKIWYKSEPEELTTWVADVSTNADKSAQFRRCVRYLKKWKENAFKNTGNDAPPSIGITIQARNSFAYCYNEGNDLQALISIVNDIKNEFVYEYDAKANANSHTIEVHLPVEPYKNVYYKMTLKQMDNFYEKISNLLEALEAAEEAESDFEACKILKKIFGEEFSDCEDKKASATPPLVVTGQSA